MRIRITLFLLVANLAVFGLIWNNARERNRERPQAELVFPVDAERITLNVAEDPGASYTLVRKAGRWVLETPFEWPANAWAVQKILDELRFVSREGGFTLEEAAAAYGNTASSYGLDKPRYTLVVSAGGVDTAVKVGAVTPDGRGVFLLAPDGKTVLPTPVSVEAALKRTPGELRQAEVFSVQPFEVNSIALTQADAGQETRVGLVRSRREAAGREPEFVWRFETPVASDADSQVVERALADLAELKAGEFLPVTPELPEKYGLSSPVMRLSLETGSRRQTLLVGAATAGPNSGRRYAKFEDNPAVFTVAAESLRPWESVRRDMREHRFMRFDADSLSGVTVHSGGRSLVLHRLDASGAAGAKPGGAARAQWRMPVVPGSTATVAFPVDADRLSGLLNALSNLSARDFAAPATLPAERRALCAAFVTDEPTPAQLAEWGFGSPVRSADLLFLDGTKRTLLIAAPVVPGTPYHAKLADAPTVYSIAPAVLESLSVRPEAYRRRTLFAMPSGARLASMRITDVVTKRVVLDEAKPDDVPDWGSWLEGRAKRERDEVFALADRCRELRVDRFLEAPYAADFRYDAGDGREPEGWRYRVEWTVKLPAGAGGAKTETRELYVTRRLGGTEQVGGSPADAAVFTLPQEWVDALFPVTFGRDGVGIPPETPAPAPADAPPAPGPGPAPASK